MSTPPPSLPSHDSLNLALGRDDLKATVVRAFIYGAGAFFLAALACLVYFLYVVIKIGVPTPPQSKIVSEQALAVLTALDVPILLVLTALVSGLIGIALIRAARHSTRDVIPPQDRLLLAQLIVDEKEKGIDQYIRLSSLTGITGFFTRIGLSRSEEGGNR